MLTKPERSIGIRHHEHTRYIKTNNPTSSYALHTLNNKHEYGNAHQITTNKTTQQRKQNELLGIILRTDFPTTKHTYR